MPSNEQFAALSGFALILSFSIFRYFRCQNQSAKKWRGEQRPGDGAGCSEDKCRGPLSQSQIDEFLSRGIVVVPGVLSQSEVLEARNGLHGRLAEHGVQVHNLEETAANLQRLSSTNGAGGILDIFYADWKFKVNENVKILSILQDLWAHSYNSDSPFFQHCFGNFCPHKAFMYIDRVCFRLPERFAQRLGGKKKDRIQRSLTPHLDCCPQDIAESLKSGEIPSSLHKWRPIQAFVALTDTALPDEGGFEACPGIHKRFVRWAQFRLPSRSRPSEAPPCVGSFSPIRPVEDRDVIRLFEHIPCRAGDLVCWDYRIPHSNARYNHKNEAREVLYLGFLPHVELNRVYAEAQLRDYLRGKNPTDQWVHDSSGGEHTNGEGYPFSEIGRRMMGLDNWPS